MRHFRPILVERPVLSTPQGLQGGTTVPVRTFSDADVPRAFPEFTVQTPNIGEGMDKVAFRATFESEDLALKILHEAVSDDAEEFDEDTATERFHREILGMATANCPHIIRVVHEPQLRVIGTSKHVWYTEPYLSGGTLFDRLKAGPLAADEAHYLAQCLFKAVDAMWNSESKFVHRDIKPKNIGFLADGTPVLIDLGIALFTEMSNITSTSIVGPGTNTYAAPEQFEIRRLANLDFRTDLFQIGIVLVESITGKHPFKASSNYFESLKAFDPTTLDSVELTPGLKRVIPRLLEAHQGRRFRKVEKALEELEKSD